MGRIPDETIRTIRDRVDAVELIGRHVALRRSGRSLKGLCPFHQEKTPSFTVHADRGTFYCFGCGEHGDVVAFLMRMESLTFPEAVRALAAECGVEVPETGGGEPGLAERVGAANAAARDFFREALRGPEGAAARRYLTERGIAPEVAARFGIGFAPDRWDALRRALAARGISDDVAARAGLLRERERGGHYDLLRGRVVFPIEDARGRVIAFGGRALGDAQPKYLNTPESPLFRKREAFYGLPHALEGVRARDRLVVVEGYFDRVALDRAGLSEAVATCGTALTEGHARALRRRSKNVVLLFDGDEAGRRAVARSLEVLLPQGLRVRAAALPAGIDPDDLLAAEGPEALRQLVDAAPPALDVAIERAVEGGCATPWEKADAVAAVVPLLARVPDPVERGAFAQRLALAAGSEPREVEAALRRALAPGRSADADAEEPRGRESAPEEAPSRHLREAVRILLAHPQLAEFEGADQVAEAAPGPVWRELAEALLVAAREATARGAALDSGALAELADGLGDAARRRLDALAAPDDGAFADPERAARAFRDTIGRLRTVQVQRRQRELTERLRREPGNLELLREKHRLKELQRSEGRRDEARA